MRSLESLGKMWLVTRQGMERLYGEENGSSHTNVYIFDIILTSFYKKYMEI